MLWTLVYDFFINHVFGGLNSNTDFGENYIFFDSNDNILDGFAYRVPFFDYVDPNTGELVTNTTLPLGNYLSLIATIITMVIIVTLCALFIAKIVKLVGGLIR